MNQKEIKELIEFLVEKDIAEFTLERGDMKLHIKRAAAVQPAPALRIIPGDPGMHMMSVPSMPPPPPTPPGSQPAAGAEIAAESPAARPTDADADLVIIKSPIVGTYYEAPSPGAPPFVKVGDTVKEGQVLCIIEAMKLMNEIEADVSGVVAKMFVPNNSPVEYGMQLFGIRKQ
jgi:acetyl-CoA carboxylase biotin carboxyl carrier protein